MAGHDFAHIVQSSIARFGPRQAAVYRALLADVLSTLVEGPERIRSTRRDDLRVGLRALHVGGRGRHIIFYEAIPPDRIEVVRILHDAMDVARHLSPG